MKLEQKIDYMIQSLQVAKDEIAYYEAMKEKEENGKEVEWQANSDRQPSGTIIRESLKMVARIAYATVDDVKLTRYNQKLTEEE